jgi:PIN domain nuclease of toxin-antitoxin system
MDKPDELPPKVKAEVFRAANMPFGLSVMSVWEASKKESIGKLRLSAPIGQWFAMAIREPYVQLQPLTIDIAHESNHLPGEFHRDPADQIIVATARQHGLTLITTDERILSYQHVRSLWS